MPDVNQLGWDEPPNDYASAIEDTETLLEEMEFLMAKVDSSKDLSRLEKDIEGKLFI